MQARDASKHPLPANADVILAALQTARAGTRVYPLRPRFKVPYFSDWQRLATCDPRAIEVWFDGLMYPDAGLGAIPPDRFVRIDVDIRTDGDGWETIEQWERAGLVLPPTLSACTPRGGRHLYYTTTDSGLSNALVGPHVELKIGATILPRRQLARARLRRARCIPTAAESSTGEPARVQAR